MSAASPCGREGLAKATGLLVGAPPGAMRFDATATVLFINPPGVGEPSGASGVSAVGPIPEGRALGAAKANGVSKDVACCVRAADLAATCLRAALPRASRCTCSAATSSSGIGRLGMGGRRLAARCLRAAFPRARRCSSVAATSSSAAVDAREKPGRDGTGGRRPVRSETETAFPCPRMADAKSASMSRVRLLSARASMRCCSSIDFRLSRSCCDSARRRGGDPASALLGVPGTDPGRERR